MIKTFSMACSLVFVVTSAFAQPDKPIQDNSFFIEEAFNQEKGVIQHVNTLTAGKKFNNYAYTFTEEWPVGGEKHQLSFTLPLYFPDGNAKMGDLLLNYRYQLLAKNNTYLMPRISFLCPTGTYGDGNGNTGIQINIPFSYEWNNVVALHLNTGTTHLWHDKEGKEVNGMLTSSGGSLIWLLRKNFNIMGEVLYTEGYLNRNDSLSDAKSLILNPGFRAALNFKSGLQIVPGFSYWFDTVNNLSGFFFYLSIEHFYKRPD
jgi:hypothetical protein